MRVCVYCASSEAVSDSFRAGAAEFGQLLAGAGAELVYGGGNVGLMGVLARSVHEHGGRVFGVIPRRLQEIEGRAYDIADTLIVTDTMQERKRAMFTRADAFAVLPGGVGTIEELMEVLTLKHLGYHDRPIVLLNLEDYFAPLIALLDHGVRHRLSPKGIHDLYTLAPTPADAFRRLTAETAEPAETTQPAEAVEPAQNGPP